MKDLGKSMVGALSKSLKENSAAKESSKDSDDIVEEMTKKQKKKQPKSIDEDEPRLKPLKDEHPFNPMTETERKYHAI